MLNMNLSLISLFLRRYTMNICKVSEQMPLRTHEIMNVLKSLNYRNRTALSTWNYENGKAC